MIENVDGQDHVARRNTQLFITAAIIVWLIALVGMARWFAVTRGPTTSDTPLTGVDPNEASWWELASLPEVGESTAKAVVDHREGERSRRELPADHPVFTQASHLDDVRGIGPATLHRIREHIRLPIAKPPTHASP